MVMSRHVADVGGVAMLECARQLYAKHFWNRPAPHLPTGKNILRLHQILDTFTKQRKGIIPTGAREEIFIQLTEGLSESIEELDERLSDWAPENGRPTRRDLVISSDSLWMQDCLKKLCYFTGTVDIIVEAIQRSVCPSLTELLQESWHSNKPFFCRVEVQSTTRDLHAPNNLSRHEDNEVSERLGTQLDNFLQGFPESHSRPDTATNFYLDPILYSRYESAQLVAKTLEVKTKQAIDATLSDMDVCFWKLRHAIYWYTVVRHYSSYETEILLI
jgi:hypothetical protein